jgi:prevent-host-death family protein
MSPKVTAAEAKNRFGEVLDAALREPVIIEKYGRAAAVLLSYAEYESLKAARQELLNRELRQGLGAGEGDRS